MTPSGEALIVRDERGETWIHQPESVGGVVLFDANLVEQAIAEHGLDRINREFANWQDLDQFRQERASAVTPDVIVDISALDLEDVERLMSVAERWAAEGMGSRARRLTLQLLRVPAVLSDPKEHERLLSFLERLDKTPVDLRSRPTNQRQAAARERWLATAA